MILRYNEFKEKLKKKNKDENAIKAVEILIDKVLNSDTNIDDIDSFYKSTTLMFFAQSNDIELVKYLLSKKADINKQNTTYGKTALMFAVEANNIEMVKLLIKEKANLNLKTKTGLTALMSAHNDVMAELLINANADLMLTDNLKQTALMHAVLWKNFETIKLLIKQKPELLNSQDIYGQTALNKAILTGDKEIIEYLLDKKINTKTISKIKLNNGQEKIVDIMQFALSNIYSWDIKSKGYSKIIKLLIEKGGYDINSRDIINLNSTILIRATEREDLDMVKYLMQKKADPYLRNNMKPTSKNAIDIVKDKIQILKKAKSKDKNRLKKNNDIKKLLEKNKFNINLGSIFPSK